MNSDTRTFSCPSCNHTFINKSKVINHQIRVHKLEIKHEACHKCDYKTVDKYNLRKHLNVHSDQKPYSCNYCKSSFSSSAGLNHHTIRIHNREKPYECNKCDSKFTTNTELKIHLRVHTEDKPYECFVCHSKFRHSRVLTTHFRVHLGDTPYSCCICVAKFSSLNALRCHERIHEVNKNS